MSVHEVVVAAPAKINLALSVGPPRADGFHPLATVYQAVGLYDEVVVRPADTFTLSVVGDGVDVSSVPEDAGNLAWQAAEALAAHHGVEAGVAMTVRKRIPVAGGMAGGSADAAGALVACDALWGLETPAPELAGIAAGLGSDVPFCLVGGIAVGTGRGEVVTPLPTPGVADPAYWWVVAPAPGGLSTPAVYRELDRLSAATQVPEPEVPAELLDALRAGDPVALGRALSNDLQRAALSLRPDLGGLLERGRAASALGALVSGSGPTCLFLAASESHAEEIVDRLGDTVPGLLRAPGPVPGVRVVHAL